MDTAEMPIAIRLDWPIFWNMSMYVWNENRIASYYNNISYTAV